MSNFFQQKSKDLGQWWRVFFDKNRGNQVDIKYFPFLFIMQIHTGVAGNVFASAWFAVLFIWYRDYWNPQTTIAAILIECGFVIIIVASAIMLPKIVYRDDDPRSPAELDYFARKWMALLLLWFAIVCSALIWITGGKSSPFISFYVMVYILALTKCKFPHPGLRLLQLYAATFAIAGLAATQFLLPVDSRVIAAIKTGPEKEWADFLFALASMIVPYWSARYAEGREEGGAGRPHSGLS